MAYGIVLEFADVDKAQYDAVNAELGLDPGTASGDWPAGLKSHAGGSTSGTGFCVYEIWESKAAHEAFMSERLGPALGVAGVPAPTRVTEVDLVGVYIA